MKTQSRNRIVSTPENPTTEKPCKICFDVKPISEFSPTGKFANGLSRHHIYCKPCFASYRKSTYSPEKRKARAAIQKEPSERTSARMKKLRDADPEHYKEYKRNWSAINKEKVAAYDRAKRANRRAVVSQSGLRITSDQWREVINKNKGLCFYCGLGFSKMTMDHFIPLSKGGTHEIGNIVPACSQCNSRKQAMDPFRFGERSGRELIVKTDQTKKEGEILSEVLVAVSAIPGVMVWRNNTGSLPTPHGTRISFGVRGSPDILGVCKGRAIGIEVKTKTGRLQPTQTTFRKAWTRAGGAYIIARSAQSAVEQVTAL